MIVVGDSECGRTNLLRVIAKGITERYTPAKARIMTVDSAGVGDERPGGVPARQRGVPDMLKELVDGAARAVRGGFRERTSPRRG